MKLARLIKMCLKETCSQVCLVHFLFVSRQEQGYVVGNFSFRGSATSASFSIHCSSSIQGECEAEVGSWPLCRSYGE